MQRSPNEKKKDDWWVHGFNTTISFIGQQSLTCKEFDLAVAQNMKEGNGLQSGVTA